MIREVKHMEKSRRVSTKAIATLALTLFMSAFLCSGIKADAAATKKVAKSIKAQDGQIVTVALGAKKCSFKAKSSKLKFKIFSGKTGKIKKVTVKSGKLRKTLRTSGKKKGSVVVIRNGCKYMYKLTRKNVSYVTKTSIKKNTVVTSNKSVKTSTAVSTEFPKSVNSNPTTVPDKEVISNGDSTVIIDNTSSVTDNVIHLYVKDISGNYQKIADIPDAGSLALECSVYNAATNTVKIQCGNYSVIANASIDADGFYCIDMKQILNNKTAYYTQQFFIF